MSLIHKLAPFAAASLLLVGLSGGANAYQCKRLNVTGAFSGVGQFLALGGARAVWSGKAKAAYGLSWSVYSIAASKQETCSPSGGGTYTCVVKAKPCNYVVP